MHEEQVIVGFLRFRMAFFEHGYLIGRGIGEFHYVQPRIPSQYAIREAMRFNYPAHAASVAFKTCSARKPAVRRI